MTTHYVYEFYDAEGNPLYVGCTGNIGTRLSNHATHRPWWSEVERIAVDTYPDKESGRAAEAELIRSLDPRYNITDTPRELEVRERTARTRIANRLKRHELGIGCRPTCRKCQLGESA